MSPAWLPFARVRFEYDDGVYVPPPEDRELEKNGNRQQPPRQSERARRTKTGSLRAMAVLRGSGLPRGATHVPPESPGKPCISSGVPGGDREPYFALHSEVCGPGA